MTDQKTALDYPWEIQVHTLKGDPRHPLYSVTTSPVDSPYWLIAAPLTWDTANHIAQTHNAALEARFEYRLEYRYDRVHGKPSAGKTGWLDGSGHNNSHSTYNRLTSVQAQKTRLERKLDKWYTGVEFRISSREVTRTEWKEVTDG